MTTASAAVISEFENCLLSFLKNVTARASLKSDVNSVAVDSFLNAIGVMSHRRGDFVSVDHFVLGGARHQSGLLSIERDFRRFRQILDLAVDEAT